MRQVLKFLLPLGLVILGGVTVFSMWSIYKLSEAIRYERHENAVQDKVNDLYQSLQAAESNQRGYLLTGKDVYLQAYLETIPDIPRFVSQLDKLAGVRSHDKLILLDDLVKSRLKELEFTVILSQKESRQEDLAVVRTDQGEAIMHQIRSVLRDIGKNAKEEARSHEAFVDRYSSTLLETVAVGSLFACLLVSAFGYLSRREIRRRARTEDELKSAQEAALIASRMKSQFLATVSHEIRTPLNGIIGMSDLLRSRVREPEQLRFVEMIQTSGEALLRIVNDILDFSKVEAGKVVFEFGEFSPRSALEMAAELIGVKARERGLSLLTYVDPRIPARVLGDEARVSQILRNLLGNAVKFTDHGGIYLTAQFRFQSGLKIVIRFDVVDSGPGIPAEQVALLFEPFHQFSVGGVTREGTGLGLSISKALVEEMGGQIGFEPEPGLGSRFWFEIPFKLNEGETVTEGSVGGNVQEQLSGGALVSIAGGAFVDTALSRYAQELGLAMVAVGTADEFVSRHDLGDGAKIIFVSTESFTPESLQKECGVLEKISGVRVILLTQKPFQDAADFSSSVFSGILRKPFTRELFLSVVTGQQTLSTTETALHLDQKQILDTENAPLILVVEDNQTNQILAEALLKERGYRVHVVANGAESLEAMKRIQYDLILMDCLMPVMDGFEATRQIRLKEASTGYRNRIVAMTANASDEDRKRCLSVGMDDFISKPFRASELDDILRKWLQVGAPTVVDWTILTELAKKTTPQIAKRLIESFVQTLPRAIDELEKAKEKMDRESLKQWSHQLKSSSAALGAMSLSRLCAELERMIDDGAHNLEIERTATIMISLGKQALELFKNQTSY